MDSQFFITYEVVDPATQEIDFVTEDRYVAEHHYGRGYTVYERHTTIARTSRFTEAQSHTILHWHDADGDEHDNHEVEEEY